MATILFKPLTVLGSAQDFTDSAPKIPLYGSSVQAGWPSPADDYIESEINLHEMLVRNPASTFFLRAAGDSMLGAGIHDGDLLIVDRSLEALSGKVVIAALDGDLLVKTLSRKNGKAFLMPANPDYPAIEITNREYVHIWGVLTYCIHKL